MVETHLLWEKIKLKKYQAIISNITLEEIEQCPEPKKGALLRFLSEIDFEHVTENTESISLSNEYINYGVLQEKSKDDLRHIALATTIAADYIVSWNFKHFVNVTTINKVGAINKLFNYNAINILPPTMLIQGDE